MTFHSTDDSNRTALCDFGDFGKPDEVPFFMPTDEVVTKEDMAAINLAATIESIGTAENSINAEIDAIDDIVSVFELLGIPSGNDVEDYW